MRLLCLISSTLSILLQQHLETIFAATSGGPTVNLPPLNFSESQQKTNKNIKKTKGTKNKTNSKKSIVMKEIPENLFTTNLSYFTEKIKIFFIVEEKIGCVCLTNFIVPNNYEICLSQFTNCYITLCCYTYLYWIFCIQLNNNDGWSKRWTTKSCRRILVG